MYTKQTTEKRRSLKKSYVQISKTTVDKENVGEEFRKQNGFFKDEVSEINLQGNLS